MDEIKVRDMYLGPVTKSQVFDFCDRWHYSGHDGSIMYKFGLYHGGILYGVITYNLATREAQAAVLGLENESHVIHMGRLCMSDEAPRNSESRLISLSIKSLTANQPNVWAVLTYAAISEGHIGYVYQATNALYTGTGGSAVYYESPDGMRRSTNKTSYEKARAKGWTIHKNPPKHRYVYILGNKSERRARMKLLLYPVLPYPKPETYSERGHTTRDRQEQYVQPIFEF